MGVPEDAVVHFRLPRVSSDRARRLIENWQELPPGFFLPLGSLTYLRAILLGISAAAEKVRRRRVAARLLIRSEEELKTFAVRGLLSAALFDDDTHGFRRRARPRG